MGKLFGTDGVRGIPGKEPLTAATVRRLGAAAAGVFGPGGGLVALGRDTRASGGWIARELAAGFAQAGWRALDLGVVPTPAVSYLAPRRGAACGAVVSASHNPAEFNGIKFFTARGFKASEKTEAAIEAGMARPRDAGPVRSPRIERDPRAAGDYLDFLRSTFPAAEDLSGLRLVVDSAHGAASGLAGELLRSLGAEVFEMGCSPDGGNINRGCGALATEAMRAEVVRRKAFCGVSLDGDSDRALFSDERGRLMNGDLVIALCALHLRRKGLLAGGKVVLTVMSNFGLRRFLEESGIGVVEVPVGDRNVTDAIEAGGYPLGGEQSGHVVFRRFSPTGDGLLTALQTLAVFVEAGGPASRFRRLYRDYPQVLRNLRVERRVPIEGLPGFQRALRLAEEPLRGRGRVFVRYSGTEPLLRILVEGPDKGEVRRISEDLARSFVESASEALERGN